METFVVIVSVFSIVASIFGYYWPKLVGIFAASMMEEVRVAMKKSETLSLASRERIEKIEDLNTIMEAIDEIPVITIRLENILFHKSKVGSEIDVSTWKLTPEQQRKLSEEPSLLQDLERLKLKLGLNTE